MRPPPSSTLFPYTTLFRSRPRLDDSEGTTPRTRRSPADSQGVWIVRQSAPGETAEGTGSRVSVATGAAGDRKSTRLNSSHVEISYAVFCLKKKRRKSNLEE